MLDETASSVLGAEMSLSIQNGNQADQSLKHPPNISVSMSVTTLTFAGREG